MDGGIRSGQDVLKAVRARRPRHADRPRLPLRPRRDGRGRRDALRCRSSRNELDLTMAFCGHTDIETVDRGVLLPGTFTTG